MMNSSLSPSLSRLLHSLPIALYTTAMTLRASFIVVSVLLASCRAQQQAVPAASLAAQLSLTTTSSPPFPTTMLDTNDTETFLVSNWGLAKGQIENGASDLTFAQDPFPSDAAPSADNSFVIQARQANETTRGDPDEAASGDPDETASEGPDETTSGGPVLQVLYSNGSYSNNNQGGAQFYSLWNPPIDSGGWKTMMVSYEVAFDNDFDWVKGGKLPGLRGGSLDGCSGGNQADGDNCFSTRIMWREGGMGEGLCLRVYALIAR